MLGFFASTGTTHVIRRITKHAFVILPINTISTVRIFVTSRLKDVANYVDVVNDDGEENGYDEDSEGVDDECCISISRIYIQYCILSLTAMQNQ